MAARDRRASARRKGEGRGPVILRFEPLEGRALLSLAAGSVAGSSTPAAVVDSTTNTTSGDEVDPVIYSLASATGESATTTSTDATDTTDDDTTTTTETTPPTLPPDLIVTAFDTLHNLDWGQTFRAKGKVRNQGAGTAPSGAEVDVYASTTRSLNAQAVYVGTLKLTSALKAGEEVSFDQPMDAPPTRIPGLNSNTSYYLIPVLDAGGTIAETNETNNGGGAADPSSVVTITAMAEPRIVGSQFSLVPVNAGQAYWGGTLQVVAQFTNTTVGTTAEPTRARVVLAPRDQSPDSASAITIGDLQVPALAAGATATVRGTVYLRSQAPSVLANQTNFTAYVVPDADYLYRAPQSNAEVRGPGYDQVNLAIQTPPTPPAPPPKADVSVKEVKPLHSTAAWSQPLQVQTTIENSGAAETGPLRVRFLLADANRPYGTPLALADAVLDSLTAGQSLTFTHTVQLQGKLPDGLKPEDIAGRIVVLVDPENAIDEASETNNGLASGPVILKLPTRQDVVGTPTTPTTPSTPSTPTTPTTPTTQNPANGTPNGGTSTPNTTSRPNLRLVAARARKAAAQRTRKPVSSLPGKPQKRQPLPSRPPLRIAPGTLAARRRPR